MAEQMKAILEITSLPMAVKSGRTEISMLLWSEVNRAWW
jgi:hypothetical protein